MFCLNKLFGHFSDSLEFSDYINLNFRIPPIFDELDSKWNFESAQESKDTENDMPSVSD